MTTGKELQLARIALDIKAKDVAAEVGVTPRVISRWERSRLVTDQAASRYREALERCVAVTTQAAG